MQESKTHSHMGFSKSAAAAVSIAYNIILIVLKIAVAWITGSVAILSEALHSLMDLVAAVIAFFSVRRADRPADAGHPYGHGKIEHIAAAFEGLLLIIASAVIVFESLRRLQSGAEIESVGLGMAVVVFSIIGGFFVGRFLVAQSRKHDSAALGGDAAHINADVLSSVAVLLGLLLVKITGNILFDSIVAILISIWIAYTGGKIIWQAGADLLDPSPSKDEMDKIEKLIEINRPPEMLGYHKLRARKSGSRCYVEVHIQLKGGMMLEDAHKSAHIVKDAFEKNLENTELLIHIEPETSLQREKLDPGGPFRSGGS